MPSSKDASSGQARAAATAAAAGGDSSVQDEPVKWYYVAHHLSSFVSVLLVLTTAPERRKAPHSADFSPSQYMRILMQRDKFTFFVWVCDLALTMYLLGAGPQYFRYWYAPRAVIVFGLRLARYHTINYQSFLLDFCYWYNTCLICFVCFFPDNWELLQACWVFGYGSLLAAVAGFHNSLVFHELDKQTSVLFHLSPALVLWTLRWFTPTDADGVAAVAVCPPGVPLLSADCRLPLVSMLAYGTVLHLIWAVFFYVYVFVLSDNLVENFAYQMAKPGSLVHTVCSPFSHHLVQKAAYMLLHYSMSMLFALPAPIWHSNKYAGAAVIVAMMLVSVWNGAGYYIEYFPRKYHEQLAAQAKAL